MPTSLKQWFHDSRPDLWRKLSAEIGGRYTEKTWRTSDRIEVEHGDWIVTLDTFIVMANNTPIPFTRFRALFCNTEKMRLKVYRASVFSEIAKFLGMQDITIGHERFDKEFIVKGNDEKRVREFLDDEGLRAKLFAEKRIELSVEDDEGWFGKKLPADVDELRLVFGGHEKDVERLKRLFELFGDALDRLCRIGSAYERRPDVRL